MKETLGKLVLNLIIFLSDGADKVLFHSQNNGNYDMYANMYQHRYPRPGHENVIVASTCDTVRIVFHTDGSVTEKGFLIRYTKGMPLHSVTIFT